MPWMIPAAMVASSAIGALAGGKNGGEISYSSSPFQTQILENMLPLWNRASNWGQQTSYYPYMGVPMPSQDWMNNISPSIQQGVWEPYKVGGQNMLAEIIGGGLGTSARGGLSNSATQLLGDYYSKAATQYGTQLWNMTYPQQMEAWRMPYNMAASSLGTTLPNPVVSQQSNPLSSIAGSVGMGLAAYGSGAFGGSQQNIYQTPYQPYQTNFYPNYQSYGPFTSNYGGY